MTCSGHDGRIVYGLIQVGDFIRTSQIQLKYGSLMRSVTPGELMCYKKSETYPHGPEFSTYICTNEIVAMLGIEPSRMDKKINQKQTILVMCLTTPRLALLEAFHLQRVTELPSSTNTLSSQYYLHGYNHLLYSLALLLCK